MARQVLVWLAGNQEGAQTPDDLLCPQAEDPPAGAEVCGRSTSLAVDRGSLKPRKAQRTQRRLASAQLAL